MKSGRNKRAMNNQEGLDDDRWKRNGCIEERKEAKGLTLTPSRLGGLRVEWKRVSCILLRQCVGIVENLLYNLFKRLLDAHFGLGRSLDENHSSLPGKVCSLLFAHLSVSLARRVCENINKMKRTRHLVDFVADEQLCHCSWCIELSFLQP